MNSGSMIAVGIMVGVMIVAWVLTRKNMRKECQYDEMQLQIRARGYQLGFYTALALMVVLILLWELDCLTAVTPGFAVFAALLLSVTVFAVYCILHGAFLAVRGNPRSYIGIFSMVVLIEGGVTVRDLIRGELTENGRMTFGSGVPLLMALCFLVIPAALVVKTIRDSKGAKE